MLLFGALKINFGSGIARKLNSACLCCLLSVVPVKLPSTTFNYRTLLTLVQNLGSKRFSKNSACSQIRNMLQFRPALNWCTEEVWEFSQWVNFVWGSVILWKLPTLSYVFWLHLATGQEIPWLTAKLRIGDFQQFHCGGCRNSKECLQHPFWSPKV